MLNVNELIGFGVGGRQLKLLQFVRALDPAITITVPSDVKAGQLLVLFDRAFSTGAITTVIPSGFTSISNVTGGATHRRILSYKLADSSDPGRVLTGMNGGTNENKLLLVFGFDDFDSIKSLTLNQEEGQITDAKPTDQVKTFSGVIDPVIIIGAFDGDTSGTISPSFNEKIDVHNANIFLLYKIFMNSPVTSTLSMNDAGNNNSIQSCYFTVT